MGRWVYIDPAHYLSCLSAFAVSVQLLIALPYSYGEIFTNILYILLFMTKGIMEKVSRGRGIPPRVTPKNAAN